MAMPVFATGHAHVNLRRALETMAEAARDARVEIIIFVLHDDEELGTAKKVLGNVPVVRAEVAEAASTWGDENPFG